MESVLQQCLNSFGSMRLQLNYMLKSSFGQRRFHVP